MICNLAAGEPHPDLAKGMRQEHCELPGHDVPFKTTNYGVTTTPEKEYKITTGETACPDDDKMDKKGKVARVIKMIEQLKTLPAAQAAGLAVVEIVAVVRCFRALHLPSPSHIAQFFSAADSLCPGSMPLLHVTFLCGGDLGRYSTLVRCSRYLPIQA